MLFMSWYLCINLGFFIYQGAIEGGLSSAGGSYPQGDNNKGAQYCSLLFFMLLEVNLQGTSWYFKLLMWSRTSLILLLYIYNVLILVGGNQLKLKANSQHKCIEQSRHFSGLWTTMAEEDIYTKDGTTDFRSNPAVKKETGTWKACPYILGIAFSNILSFTPLKRDQWKKPRQPRMIYVLNFDRKWMLWEIGILWD